MLTTSTAPDVSTTDPAMFVVQLLQSSPFSPPSRFEPLFFLEEESAFTVQYSSATTTHYVLGTRQNTPRNFKVDVEKIGESLGEERRTLEKRSLLFVCVRICHFPATFLTVESAQAPGHKLPVWTLLYELLYYVRYSLFCPFGARAHAHFFPLIG